MKDTLYLTTRLGNITEEYIPNTEEGQAIRNARIEMILWCTNAGRLRTKKEVENYISNMQEEIIGYQFANDTSYLKKVSEAKLQELKLYYQQMDEPIDPFSNL